MNQTASEKATINFYDWEQRGRGYYHFDDPVNTTMINERCIELTLGLRYIEKVGNDNLTEVGCVMPFYGYCEHPIIDLFENDEPAGDVQNVD